MNVEYSKRFVKQYKKLSPKLKVRVRERINIFIQDPFNSKLENHSLHGEYEGFRSINITGDIRLIYELLNDGTARLGLIGTHHELYGS